MAGLQPPKVIAVIAPTVSGHRGHLMQKMSAHDRQESQSGSTMVCSISTIDGISSPHYTCLLWESSSLLTFLYDRIC